MVAQLRERIDLATHYGSFRPGQVFSDAMRDGGRGPQMVVVPHGGFQMGPVMPSRAPAMPSGHRIMYALIEASRWRSPR